MDLVTYFIIMMSMFNKKVLAGLNRDRINPSSGIINILN